MSIEQKLADLGIALPDAPAPAANYVPFVKLGDTLYVSGQISSDADGLIRGKLGAGMTVEAGAAAARKAARRSRFARSPSPTTITCVAFTPLGTRILVSSPTLPEISSTSTSRVIAPPVA